MVLVNNMKYKIKHEKSNLILMSSILILCLITCYVWFIFREYIYFSIYLILTIIITHIYYFTYYYIKNDSLIIKLGFIRVKIKYNQIKSIEILKNSIKLNLEKISLNLYPNKKDMFYTEINSKMKGI